MLSRRNFLNKAMLTSAATLAAPILSPAFAALEKLGDENPNTFGSPSLSPTGTRFKPGKKFGLGGVALGNGFQVNTDQQIRETLEAAWQAGVRYFDTSPWYGLGLSERRLGHFLYNKKREDYVLSTKIGRILIPDADFKMPEALWKGKLNFNYKYDYSAAGTRKSVEDSLHRLGLPYLDIVFIHDLSPDNEDMGEKWTEYFDEAQKGAMPELTKMREEGLIKAWGMGVNTIEPALKAMEVADPDIMLSATKYSLMYHEDALENLFPVCAKNDVSIVSGAPLNGGFLAGLDRFNYSNNIPEGYNEKRNKMYKVADNHKVDLRSASLQFCAAPDVVSSVIPGASRDDQATANAVSMNEVIPPAFWKELKEKGLISKNAPEPKVE